MPLDFDVPHRDADPWGYKSRWYEARRRQLIAAMLPHAHLGEVLELGCSTGLITALLAPRAQRVLAMDVSFAAVDKARQRLQAQPHVQVLHANLVTDWPADRFDSFLVCDVGYYLQQPQLEQLARQMSGSARPHSFVLVAHWRHAFAQVVTPTEQVHKILAVGLGWHRQACYQDEDLLIELWSSTRTSVAQQEGLA